MQEKMKFTAVARKMLAAALALVAFAPEWALAGNFSVSPVRVYMTPRDRAMSVTVENEGKTPLTVQAEAFVWSQSPDGKDKLTPTDDLVIAPPIVKIPVGGRQVIRLARAGAPDLSQQLSYRLIVSELPDSAASKAAQAEKGKISLGVDFYLAMSMPVFITPPLAKRELACQFGRKPGAVAPSASCKSTGNAYAQVRKITFMQGEKESGVFDVGALYILPGATRSLDLKAASAGQAALPAGAYTARVLFDDGKSLDLNAQLP
jgi:fimbrial chaperone protein